MTQQLASVPRNACRVGHAYREDVPDRLQFCGQRFTDLAARIGFPPVVHRPDGELCRLVPDKLRCTEPTGGVASMRLRLGRSM